MLPTHAFIGRSKHERILSMNTYGICRTHLQHSDGPSKVDSGSIKSGKFWPVLGYDAVDTSSTLVLTLLHERRMKLTGSEIRRILAIDLRMLIQEYTKEFASAIGDISSSQAGMVDNLLQGLLNEVTAFAACVVDWNPRLYRAHLCLHKDQGAKIDWQAALEAIGLSHDQEEELLCRSKSYLSSNSEDAFEGNDWARRSLKLASLNHPRYQT
eukprot:jgi/Botrbrau1/10127/Bobra.20_2s0031.1